jgi:hypothetical protein
MFGVSVLALDHQIVDLGLTDEEEVLGEWKRTFAS